MPSASTADLSSGSKRYNDIDITLGNCRFEEREKTGGGLSPVAIFVSDVEMLDGHTEEMVWEVAPVEFFNDRDSGEPRCFVDDGKLLDADGQKPYGISNTSEFGMLSNSLEGKGVSPSILVRCCAEPELLNGVKIHAVREAVPGRSFVAKKGTQKGQTVNWEVLVADRVIEDPNADNAGRRSKGKPVAAKTGTAKPAATAATAARKPGKSAAAPQPDPEPEVEELSELDAAAIDVVNLVLSDPKTNGVKTYSARQNGGGVTLNQMATAVMTTYKGKTPSKNDVVSTVRDAAWAEATAEAGGWTFDSEKGLYFTAE